MNWEVTISPTPVVALGFAFCALMRSNSQITKKWLEEMERARKAEREAGRLRAIVRLHGLGLEEEA